MATQNKPEMANVVKILSSNKGNKTAATATSAPVLLKFALDGRQRAHRSKNTKTRSGCITCK